MLIHEKYIMQLYTSKKHVLSLFLSLSPYNLFSFFFLIVTESECQTSQFSGLLYQYKHFEKMVCSRSRI